jgi:acyl-coenzyme A synthetase/AMP-(fatty) acid ligase
VLTDGTTNAADLKQHVRDELANYKVPRDITVLDELPRNNTGELARNELRATLSRPPTAAQSRGTDQ